MLEFLEKHPVGETLSTDSDAFQYTITPQLVQDQLCSNLASLNKRKNFVTDQSVSWSVLSMQWYSALSVLTWSGLSLEYQQFTVNMAKNLTVYLLSSHGLE